MALLLHSRRDDWLAAQGKGSEGYLHLEADLDVTLRDIGTDVEHWVRFDGDWTREFADPVADRQRFDLWYRASYVKTCFFVPVDGAPARGPAKVCNGVTASA
jgi:hypothetical protein